MSVPQDPLTIKVSLSYPTIRTTAPVLLPRGLHPIILESKMKSDGTETLARKWITSESITAVTGLR
jgi:hypothetical protein